MTYLRRALKYFLQICLIFIVIIGILMLSGMVSKDVEIAFRHGWTSIMWIAGLFAVMSFAYPFFGYGKRNIHAKGDPAELWAEVDKAMESRNYVPAGVTPEGAHRYHLSSPVNRASRMWEDTITFERQENDPYLVLVDGPSRDTLRIVGAVLYNYRMSHPQSEE